MKSKQNYLLLADDDTDDCLFFREILDELNYPGPLLVVNDGVELIRHLLDRPDLLPDLLFLDLNMPRKNGMECLREIKAHEKLKSLTVVVISTSLNEEEVDALYEIGAQYYIRKPGEYSKLKHVIHKAIGLASQNNSRQPDRADFVIDPNANELTS